MDHILASITIALCALYDALCLLLTVGLFRTAKHQNTTSHSVTVIIPAKNEENNIQACLEALSKQNYATEKAEIIVVNDHSTDRTINRAQQTQLPNLKIVSVTTQDHLCPKKNAIHQGIKASSGEIILTTDADCRPEPHWISDTVKCFTPPIGMVMGYAPLRASSAQLNPLLELQSLVVAALSAGSTGIGFPLTCTGRNLAYRRKAYDDVNGFDGFGHIIGGDDIYLMQKMAQTPYKIAFNLSPLANVPSQVHTDNQFNRQLRYQSKSLHYGPRVLLLALAVYIFHLILMLSPVWFCYLPTTWNSVGYCFLAKITADALFLGLAAQRFHCLKKMVWFPVLEVILFPYIVIVCALGALVPTKWK